MCKCLHISVKDELWIINFLLLFSFSVYSILFLFFELFLFIIFMSVWNEWAITAGEALKTIIMNIKTAAETKNNRNICQRVFDLLHKTIQKKSGGGIEWPRCCTNNRDVLFISQRLFIALSLCWNMRTRNDVTWNSGEMCRRSEKNTEKLSIHTHHIFYDSFEY